MAGRPTKRGKPGSYVYPGAEYTDDELEFMLAVQRYKEQRRRPHPSWREILWIAHSLGYRRVVCSGPTE